MKNAQASFLKASSNRAVLLLVLVTLLFVGGCQTATKTTSENVQSNTTVNGTATLNDIQKATYQVALEAMSNQSYVKAESLLQSLTKEQPSVAGPWANLGLIALMTKKPSDAERYIKKAFELNPNMPQVLNLMGLLSLNNRDVKSALKYYQSAIESKSNYANAHYNLALLYDIYLQNIPLAVQHYKLYLENNSSDDQETQVWVEQLEASLR